MNGHEGCGDDKITLTPCELRLRIDESDGGRERNSFHHSRRHWPCVGPSRSRNDVRGSTDAGEYGASPSHVNSSERASLLSDSPRHMRTGLIAGIRECRACSSLSERWTRRCIQVSSWPLSLLNSRGRPTSPPSSGSLQASRTHAPQWGTVMTGRVMCRGGASETELTEEYSHDLCGAGMPSFSLKATGERMTRLGCGKSPGDLARTKESP